MDRISKVILSNMCMVYEGENVLVMDRAKHDWGGLTFPGGHVEVNETLIEAVIREMKEETGLDIKNPELCGIKEWDWGNETRYIALLYKTKEFSGEIKASDEGKIFWINKKDLHKYKLSTDFEEIFNICIK